MLCSIAFPVGRLGSCQILEVICEAFDETSRRWGWEPLAAPEPARSAFLEDRRRWFEENLARPRYEAAIAWEAGCKGLECPVDIEAIADEGAIMATRRP